MLRAMLTVAGVIAAVGAGAPAMAGGCEGCDLVAKKGEGFHCGKGLVYGVELTSKKLFEALAGQKVEADKIKCPGCKYATKTNGICSHCKVGAAGGKLYHSMLSHKLAKGLRYSEKKVSLCGGCKTAYRQHGRCTGCNVGFVSKRMFKDQADYDVALAARKTLVAAVEVSKKCETCAVAMVTDGKCAKCNISFKDGKKSG